MKFVGAYVKDFGAGGRRPLDLRVFYKAVVQVTLLFVEDSWVMSPQIVRTLGVFRHRVSRRLAKIHPERDMMGRWIYPPLGA